MATKKLLILAVTLMVYSQAAVIDREGMNREYLHDFFIKYESDIACISNSSIVDLLV